jgi:hypothetical protein
MVLRYHKFYGLLPTLPKSRVLTCKMLIDANACKSQVTLFKDIFGSRVYVSQASLRKAANQGMNIAWFGRHFAHDWVGFTEAEYKLDKEWEDTSMSIVELDNRMAALVYRFLKFSD